jgi:hypothetical protein
MALTPTIAQTENRVRNLATSGMAGGQKEAVVRYFQNKLAQLTMQGAVGTDEYLVVAGELQAIKDADAKAQMAPPNARSVISDLLPAPLTPTPPMMPQGMPQGVAQGMPQGVAPENAGGLAAMEAPNMESIDMAGGGLVAFADGGEIPRYQNQGLVQAGGGPSLTDVLRTLTMDERRFYQQTGQLPPRAQSMLTGQAPMPAAPTPGMGTAGTGPATVSMAADPNAPAQVPLPENMRFYPGIPPLIDGKAANVAPRPTLDPKAGIEAILAQAERGEGPNVSRPGGIRTDIPLPGREPAGKDEGKKEEGGPGGLADIAKAKGMDYNAAYEQAETMLGKKLAALGDPLADIKEELKNASGERKKQLEQNAWLRFSEFGFGFASGDKEAAVKAIKGFGDDLREKEKLSREDRRLLTDIKRLEAADKRGNVIKTADYAFDILKNADANQRADLQMRTQLQIANIGKTTASLDRASQRDLTRANNALEQARKIVEAGIGAALSPEQKEAKISELAASIYQRSKSLESGEAGTGTPSYASAAAAELARRGK